MSDLPDPFDELISAYLDGECTPDEVARVESDPVLMARVEVMRPLVARLGAPLPEASAAEVDRDVTMAMGALDARTTADPIPTVPPASSREVVDHSLDRRRARRGWGVAAAAVASVAAVGVAIAASLGGGGGLASSSGGEPAAIEAAASQTTLASPAYDMAAARPAADGFVDLGAIDDPDLVPQLLAPPTTVSTTLPGATTTVAAAPPPLPGESQPVGGGDRSATASGACGEREAILMFRGTPAFVRVTPDGAYEIVDEATCAVLATAEGPRSEPTSP